MPKDYNKQMIEKKKCYYYCNEGFYCTLHKNCNKYNFYNKILLKLKLKKNQLLIN
jgi:hypothetical protein